MSRVSAALRREIRLRADGRCEYCRHPDALAGVRFEAEHIVPVKLQGEATFDNTAWACFQCNRFKGAAVAGYDHEGADVVRLFNPRRDEWDAHFSMDNGVIRPHTRIGRITTEVLRLNDPRRIDARRILMSRGHW